MAYESTRYKLIMSNKSNFRIICSTDSKLVDYLIHKDYPTCTRLFNIEDPFTDIQKFNSKSFLTTTNEPKYYVCKNLEVFLDAEDYWDNLLSGKFCKSNYLFLVVDKLDSRTKFTKKFKTLTITPDITKLNILDILPELEALNTSQYIELFKNCGQSLDKTYLEFNKIKLYAESQNINCAIAYKELKSQNILAQSVDDNIFNLVEDIVNKDIQSIYKKLYVLSKNEFDFSLLVNLYNTFRMLYIYEECAANNALANSGLTAFNIKTVAKFHNKYSKQQLLGILRFLQKIDIGIKQGTLSSDYALDYMIVGALSS